ncbi:MULTISPECIES: copper resistance CopC/CopD family protein [Paenibacillus]|nr:MULTISPECIES: copper resistance protein CopC [Paenibacillus]NTZ20637.1 hypothetical protein [Paenibacillus sp. JMULE4]GCL74395.1 hypothetical protein PN4B1_43480 [Paenibacillus naphthalenovorans]SDJ02823.1 copper transport protein [Paenibacillus naphthalenovorans]
MFFKFSVSRMIRRPVYFLIVCWMLVFALGWAPRADAHASLVEAVPAAGSELVQAPEQVVLTFNEPLEKELYQLRVYDKDKRLVTQQGPVMSDNQTAIKLDLPQLGQGTYLVTYHVISADGHPVNGTYLFAVGESLSGQAPADGIRADMEHLHYHDSGPFDRFGVKDVLQFASRIAFYVTMLGFTGLLLWLRWFGTGSPLETKNRLRRNAERWQQFYLIVYILFMWAHMGDLIGDAGAGALLRLFSQTTIGYAWLGGLLLALLSFVMLYRNALLDYAWVAAVWVAKSMLGHAAAFQPAKDTLTLDFMHLAASSVWVGGLLTLLLLWRHEREQARRLYPFFSMAAMISILVLIASGVLMTFIFLPDIRYIVETLWGKLLIVKTALVLAVVVTASLIRYFYRRNHERTTGRLIRADVLLMSLILGIAGVFTYLLPAPANEPLNWHVMGEKIHMTAQISPNAPGVNDFTAKVWLPEKLGKPKQVIMKLQSVDSPEIAPLMVPLESFEDPSFEESFGMKRHSYKARGAYLPYPGRWKLEVRVMDSNDDETVYEKEIRIF